jgi:hypothetical protein
LNRIYHEYADAKRPSTSIDRPNMSGSFPDVHPSRFNIRCSYI